jgi:3-deoxy-D-manno-octulosonate 8-phosphate phosphatase (KDO 8-P phosphatase)
MNETLKSKLMKIQLVISDVDGVLTDGSVYIGNDGQEFKKFSVSDGAGIAMARAAGYKLAFISGRFSQSTELRARELNIDDVYNGVLKKLDPYAELKSKYKLQDEQIAYIGDDLIDLPVMETVGIPIAVNNAQQVVKDTAIFTTLASGGNGALREAIEWIIIGQDRMNEVLNTIRQKIHEGKA